MSTPPPSRPDRPAGSRAGSRAAVRPADVPPPRPSAPPRDDDDMGPTTWLDGLLAESGHATTPIGLTGLPTRPADLRPPAGPPGRSAPPAAGSTRSAPTAANRRAAQAGTARARTAFDACQLGVALRALLFVHGVLALGLAFGASGWHGWLVSLGLAVAAALPATLAWLCAVCAAQGLWLRLPLAAQWGAMAALGGLCAVLGWWPLVALELLAPGGLGALAPLATGAALAAAIFHWLQLRARLQLPATTVARLAELQSRIRPHFLFNALNSAVALVRLDPPRAEEVLEDLAELFRAALVGAGEQVTLGEEIALAQRYLAIEQVRFGARLKVSWQVDPDTETARVPSLLLQPLVENAVRHGVESAPEGGDIQIRTQVHKGQALISITNSVPSGPPRSTRKGQGMALHNVRERLQLLHDLTMRFEAGLIASDRYRVRIAVPLVA